MAFHEGIPGHHLQLAIASELEDVPEFRKHLHNSAYAEGWGLYTERLSDEMGLYTGAVDRMGMFAADSMRACRLVVDTGLHALGWSREQAVEYMVANSPLADGRGPPGDRPLHRLAGQATSYMVGRLEIQRMRAEAEQRQGSGFEVKRFHSAVLDSGRAAARRARRGGAGAPALSRSAPATRDQRASADQRRRHDADRRPRRASARAASFWIRLCTSSTHAGNGERPKNSSLGLSASGRQAPSIPATTRARRSGRRPAASSPSWRARRARPPRRPSGTAPGRDRPSAARRPSRQCEATPTPKAETGPGHAVPTSAPARTWLVISTIGD